MSIVRNLDNIVDWARTAICQKVKLKLPDDDANDASYTENLVTPEAFVLYVPTRDRLPPKAAAPIPSICVQLVEGKDIPSSGSGRFKIRFCLSAWNPGEHGGDTFIPTESETHRWAYRKWTGPEASKHFVRNCEGWRDVWNFTDIALQAIENTEYIAGLRLVKEDGIEYGPFTEESGIVDYYPYWFSWIQCTLEHGLSRKTSDSYKDLL